MSTFISTRGHVANEGNQPITFEDVLLEGLAPDGGLYIPTEWPQLDIESLKGKSYTDVAYAVMQGFVGDAISEDEFRAMIEETYGRDVFDHQSVTPLVQLSEKHWIMELHRGPTLAFKDVALQLLGRLFDKVLERRNEHVTIVGATSGDTGSAAIEGCKSCAHVDIFILHPKGRVSDVQRKQMTTVKGDNVHNIAIEGTFDDCQDLVKDMFNDPAFRSDMRLSAINSINWARIMAQIVYYVTTALALGAPERKVSFSVPTGNFGNVLAAYVARKMGVPMGDLIVSSNRNDILTRFFESGAMKKDGVEASLSPSMDIQISSNFERYLFELLGRDSAKLSEMMDNFKQTGVFEVDDTLMQQARADFKSHRCDDDETLATIKRCYDETAEIIDPHTAVGLSGAFAHEDEIDGPIVTLACAHAAKFPDAVEKAIAVRPGLPDRLNDLFEREEFLTPLPNDLATVQQFVRDHSTTEQKSAA